MNAKNYIVKIQDILKKTGWSQVRLAQECDVTFAALNRWLNGHAVPQPSKQTHISQLHREFVGLQPIQPAEYSKILNQAKKLKNNKIKKLFLDNQNLVQELIVDSTYNSNTIEGTKLTYRETEVLIFSHTFAENKPFEDNIVSLNHAAIVKDIFKGDYRYPVTQEIICDMHRRLFQGIRDDAGHYSKLQRVIGGLNIQLTHPSDIPSEMEDLVKSMKSRSKKLEFVEELARDHARFELIHPFGDGNGRIGRLIMILTSLHYDYPPPIIENKRKAEYYEVLEEAQRRSTEHLTRFLVEEMNRLSVLISRHG